MHQKPGLTTARAGSYDDVLRLAVVDDLELCRRKFAEELSELRWSDVSFDLALSVASEV